MLPKTRNQRQIIHRIRKKTIPKDAKCYSEIEIPDELKKTIKGEPFLLHDSGKNDPNRFLLFGAKETIKYLKRIKLLAMDGTFHIAPKNLQTGIHNQRAN